MALRAVKDAGDQDHRAQLAEVEAFAESLPDEYIRCRELNHTWQPFSAAVNRRKGVIQRTLRCPRCKTRKIQELTMNGGLHSSYYEYPDGYQHKGHGQIFGEGRSILRINSIFRGTVIEVDDEADMPRAKAQAKARAQRAKEKKRG